MKKPKTSYVVIKGAPFCLTRGFDTLRSKKGAQKWTVDTTAEKLERWMKLVYVEEYDPVTEHYYEAGDFWADINTGTLYRPFDGVCMSSNYMRLVL